MSLFGNEQKKVRSRIAQLDMSNYIKKAREYFGLAAADVDQAAQEYRHFLYLLYWNRQEANRVPVVPTKRADTIWHGHLLFNAEYNAFCTELYGEIVAHRPGLEEGTDPFITAVLHTKKLHDRVGKDGFDKDYFSYVEKEPLRKKSDTSDSLDSAVVAGGCGGSGCGGGGCGGGCGG